MARIFDVDGKEGLAVGGEREAFLESPVSSAGRICGVYRQSRRKALQKDSHS